MPKPNDGEQKDDWMHRCMGHDTMKQDFEDQKQRVAVCYKLWRDKHPGDKPPADAKADEKPEAARAQGKRFEILAKDNKAAEIYLYTSIGERYFNGISSSTFQKELTKLGKAKELTVYIDSDGGSVFDGITIYNQLVRHPAYVTTVIDGLAASIASIIACAGSWVKMSSSGMFVTHEPWAGVTGTSTDMRREADALDKIRENMIAIYASRTKYLAEKIRPMLADETWLQAHEALSHGFIDEIIPGEVQAACLNYDLSRFKHAPSWYGRATVEMPKVLHYRHKHGQLFHVVKEESRNG